MSSKEELAQSLPHWSSWRNNVNDKWYKDPSLRRCLFNVMLLYGSVFAYGYDNSVISSVQALPYWGIYFNQPSGIRLGLITSGYLFPQIAFSFLGSYLADKLGRKPTIAMSATLGIVGPCITAFGNNIGTFVAGRVLTGCSTGWYLVTALPLIAEISHPRFRARSQATIYTGFAVGGFICGWVGYGCATWASNWSWRVTTFLQCLGSVPLFFWALTPWMAESPRWLVRQGRRQQAIALLAHLHSNGDENDELVLNEMAEIVAAVELDQTTQRASISEFFATPGNRKRLLSLIWFAWYLSMAGQNLFAYYLPVILESVGFTSFIQIQGFQAGLSALIGVVSFIASQLVERVGRKSLVMTSVTGVSISFTIFTALCAHFSATNSHATAIGVVVMIFVFCLFLVMGSYNIAFLYMPEILPFNLRTTGMAIYTISTNMGAVYNGLVNPVAIEAIAWKYYLVFVVLNWISVVIAYFLLVETKGLTLEDIAVLFDGEQASVVRGDIHEKLDEELKADRDHHVENAEKNDVVPQAQ